MTGDARPTVLKFLSVLLSVLVLAEVNYPWLSPQSQLALFAMLGLAACYLMFPARRGDPSSPLARRLDWLGVGLAVACCGYVVVQTEPLFRRFWLGGESLGHRAGQESALDLAVGAVGLILVLEGTRRALGVALPLLASLFVAYAALGPVLPAWLFPHRGYGAGRIVAQTFLHSQGVFGVALRVMFTYVFLFVLLGALLERSGATAFVLAIAQRVFRRSPGGPAKVAVIASGLMGSLSGSAVANTATTGTFTIPMMRSAGFRAEIAAGIEAAASSGGALVPPVMGAGAYMMLEIVDPPVTYLQILRAALLPAILYYLSLFLIVHFHSRRLHVAAAAPDGPRPSVARFEGLVFLSAFGALLTFLLLGQTVPRAVSLCIALCAVVASLSPRTRGVIRDAVGVCAKASRDVASLIMAAACVGIILGIVTLTGVGTRFPALLIPLAEHSLVLALALIMVSSLVLGMGLPSAVCYLLLATLVGPFLGALGVVPLAAHLFIFYFGMMSMVTPPVALAAYTAGSIAGTDIMRTGLHAFRFALVGFTLPYMFVFRPELLLLGGRGGLAGALDVTLAVGIAVLGIVPFAAGIAGWLFTDLPPVQRLALFAASALLLFPGPHLPLGGLSLPVLDILGAVLLAAAAGANWRRARRT